MDIADDTDGFIGETGTFQADEIDHFDTAVTAFSSHEGGDVFGHGTDAGDHGETSDTAELVNCTETGNESIVCNFSVTAEDGSIDDDHVVADFAVVGNV